VSLSFTMWDYVPVVPMLIALVNGVIAVYVGHFKPENQWLKVTLLLFAIVASLAAAATTVAGQYHTVQAFKQAQAEITEALVGLGKLIEEGHALSLTLENQNIPVCQIASKRDPLSRPIPTPRGVTNLGG
jgi:hypothetical protein